MGNNKKQEYLHEYKLLLIRECLMFGKSFKDTQIFFKSRGISQSQSQYTRLKNELKSDKISKEWFGKEIEYVIENDHRLSVERIRLVEDRLMQEFEQVSSTSYYENFHTAKSHQELKRNKNHDSGALIRLSSEIRAIQETKTKLFSATPFVQELMEVRIRHEELQENYDRLCNERKNTSNI